MSKRVIESVAGVLENYAQRGIFRGFSQGPVSGGKTVFKMTWHRDRQFELILDVPKKTMRFPLVLPNVPAGSEMYREFKAFVASRFSDDFPDHRRIDNSKVAIKPVCRSGSVSLTLTVKDGDFEYAARRLIHLVHEIFLVFLYDGKYYDYLVETFDLDPDRM